MSLACLLGFLFAAAALPQTKTNPPQQQNQKTTQPDATKPPAQLPPDETLPPEEDESVAPKVYTFDPARIRTQHSRSATSICGKAHCAAIALPWAVTKTLQNIIQIQPRRFSKLGKRKRS